MLDKICQDLDALCRVCHLFARSYGSHGELVGFAIDTREGWDDDQEDENEQKKRTGPRSSKSLFLFQS